MVACKLQLSGSILSVFILPFYFLHAVNMTETAQGVQRIADAFRILGMSLV